MEMDTITLEHVLIFKKKSLNFFQTSQTYIYKCLQARQSESDHGRAGGETCWVGRQPRRRSDKEQREYFIWKKSGNVTSKEQAIESAMS